MASRTGMRTCTSAVMRRTLVTGSVQSPTPAVSTPTTYRLQIYLFIEYVYNVFLLYSVF